MSIFKKQEPGCIWLKCILIPICIALALRIGLWIWAYHVGFNFGGDFDQASYHRIAFNLISGNGYSGDRIPPFSPTAYRPPAFIMLLVPFYAIRPYPELGSLLSVMFSVLTVGAVGYLGFRSFGFKAGQISALMIALSPTHIAWSVILAPDSFLTLMIVVSMCCLSHLENSHHWKWGVGFGVALGAAVLTKAIGSIVLLASLLVFGWLLVRYSGLRKPILLAFLVVSLTVAPWLVRNYCVYGQVAMNSHLGLQLLDGELTNIKSGVTKRPIEEIRSEFRELVNKRIGGKVLSDVELSNVMVAVALEEIPDYLGPLILSHLGGAVLTTILPSRGIWEALITGQARDIGLGAYVFQHGAMKKLVGSFGLTVGIFIGLEGLFSLLLAFFAVIGLFHIRHRLPLWFTTLILVTLLLLLGTGPAAASRYAMPYIPCASLLASMAITRLRRSSIPLSTKADDRQETPA